MFHILRGIKSFIIHTFFAARVLLLRARVRCESSLLTDGLPGRSRSSPGAVLFSVVLKVSQLATGLDASRKEKTETRLRRAAKLSFL